MIENPPSNQDIAAVLDQIAELLSIKQENPYKIGAYRDAAKTVRKTDKNIANIVQNDPQSLEKLKRIGKGISSVIIAYVLTGRSGVLERLQGEVSPVALFSHVPGIGPKLAQRIVDTLKITSLAELEQAAIVGRLTTVNGFGKTKARNVLLSLSGMLSPISQNIHHQSDELQTKRPTISTLLHVDREYRKKATAGDLHKIAPKRLNPEGKAWLPILNTHQDGWSFTALYSNTARAHELDKTHDWVVLYYHQGGRKSQVTVVTETKGSLKGKRVIRGREKECKEYYENQSKLERKS